MENLLIQFLTPILGPMGVSQADLTTYVSKCIGYINAILIATVVMIVVMVAAHFVVKKGTRHVVRWTAALAWLLVIVLVANLVCFGPLYGNLSMMLNSTGKLTDETIANSEAVVKEVGEDGMVLVKNTGLLPLSSDVKNLNVFGWDSSAPIFGGTGSGSGDTSNAVGIIQSLQDAGYATNEELTQIYKDYHDGRAGGMNISSTDWTLYEPTMDYYTDDVMKAATDFSNTAVICLGRSGGEGSDLPMDMKALIDGTYDIRDQVAAPAAVGNYNYFNSVYFNNGDYDDFDEGEHYLQLSNTEEALVDLVCSNFENVIVLVNANNTMELSWVDDYPQIGAVILAPGTGVTAMAALGEILKGDINPSGRTVDTFVKDLTKTPTYNNVGNFAFTNVDDLKDAIAANDNAYEGSISFVNYVEGIYVGYKFWETAAEEGLINYDEMVQYPFGYGLSYTTFSQEIQNFDASGDNITFDVLVTNTGSVAGKDVVEVYFTPPYTNGGIEKASVNLIEFGKTDTLEAGASQTVSFSIPKEELASYDSEGIKVSGGGYILEAGEYTISVRSDSHTVIDSETFTVTSDEIGHDSDMIPAVNHFDYAKGDVTYLSRADGFANYDEATAAPSADAYVMSDEVREAVTASAVGFYDPTLYDDSNDVMPTTGADNGMKLSDMTGKSYDDPDWDKLLDQLTIDDMSLLVNLGGWQTAAISSVGKIATFDSDGPAGVNNFITGNMGTIFPAETLMAQTWSKTLLSKVGDAMGREFSDLNNYGWYGPAMNMHRSAFAGRNFEYYSEDGVLSGRLAAEQVNAAAATGTYGYIKHFVLNDQETNRCAFLLTYSNEQAMREIYMRPFEITVKNFEYQNLAVMSSFNWIGTVPAGANYDSLTTVLRDEWGFRGMVETDYDGSYGYQIADHCVRAGNDLMLGFNAPGASTPGDGFVSSTANSNELTDTGAATLVIALRQSCKNILYTTCNSGFYTNGNADEQGMDNMTKMFIAIDVVAALVVIAIEVIVLMRWLKKKKAAAN